MYYENDVVVNNINSDISVYDISYKVSVVGAKFTALILIDLFTNPKQWQMLQCYKYAIKIHFYRLL